MPSDLSDVLTQVVNKFFETKTGVKESVLGFTIARSYILRLESQAVDSLFTGNTLDELNAVLHHYGFEKIQCGINKSFIGIGFSGK